MSEAGEARGRRVVIKRDEDVTLDDVRQGKRDCALLMRLHGKSPLLIAWLGDLKEAEARLARLDDLDDEIDQLLKGAA